MRYSLERMRSSLVRIRSSLVIRASGCQCTSCNGPGFNPSIRRHSGIWGAADEAVLNIVRKKKRKNPPKKYFKKIYLYTQEIRQFPPFSSVRTLLVVLWYGIRTFIRCWTFVHPASQCCGSGFIEFGSGSRCGSNISSESASGYRIWIQIQGFDDQNLKKKKIQLNLLSFSVFDQKLQFTYT